MSTGDSDHHSERSRVAALRGALASATSALGFSKRTRENLLGYGFVLPNIVVFAAFRLLPVLAIIYISFHEWSILGGKSAWVGLQNYIEIMTPLPWADGWAPLREPTANVWWFSLRNTLIYAIIVVPIQVYGGLFVALLLQSRGVTLQSFRAIYFFPFLVSGAISATIWKWLFSSNGVVNALLRPLGLEQSWLGDPMAALATLIVVGSWIGIGFNMILFTAGLQNIPEELYEAARLDGASRWQRFRYITWPGVSETSFFATVLALISSIQVFGIPWVIGQGGPYYGTTTAVVRIYQTAFQNGAMGEASAMSVILFLVVFAFSYQQFKVRQKQGGA